jgi:HD-like signal output (HDOD) protein
MREDRDEALIQAVLASGIHIPPMPDSLLQLQRLSSDEQAGPRQFARLIEQDGALSGAVFRLAGSPVFGLRARIASVEAAIAVLGVRNTAALVRNETLRSALHDPAHAQALETLWNRTGAIAEWMLRAHRQGHLRGICQDHAFTLGLFHDCGLALLIKRFPDYARALTGASWPDIAALDHANHTHHALVGQMVARNWQLDAIVVAAVRHHHQLDTGELPDAVARLCALLNFATHLHHRTLGIEDDAWETGWRVECGQRLGFDDAEMAEWEMETAALGPV